MDDSRQYDEQLGLARYVVASCADAGDPCTISVLHNWMYLLQFIYCVDTGDLLFDGRFEARGYGPVLPAVGRRYACYRCRPIMPDDDEDVSKPLSDDKMTFVDGGIADMLSHPVDYLYHVIYGEEYPWYIAFYGNGCHTAPIPNRAIVSAARSLAASIGR